MAGADGIILSRSPGETRLALMAGDTPVEFLIDRGGAGAGDILLGRVLSVNRALDAAFVDIGEALAAFLPRPGALSEGDEVLVQVTGAEQAISRADGKGAGVTRAISLQGGLLALTPFRPGLNLSRKIGDAGRRASLKALLAPVLAEGEGLVVRTDADGARDDDLLVELASLRARWTGIVDRARTLRPPAPVVRMTALERCLRVAPGVRRLLVDDRAALPEAQSLVPEARFQADCFEDLAGEAFDAALERHVPLPGGGRITIDETQALTAIDIDSGGRPPQEANLAAIAEIARQIRLRGLAGHLLIDVIPQKDPRAVNRLLAALREAVAGDPTPAHVLGVTPLGMIEMTRDRLRPSLSDLMLEGAARPATVETVALAALRAMAREADRGRPGAVLRLAARPAVISHLRGRPQLLAEMTDRLGRAPRLVDDPAISLFEITEDPT